MRREHLKYLVCPDCKCELTVAKEEASRSDSIETGLLECQKCKATHPIIRHIPRFVPLENYASSFGLEWKKHARTQYDSYSGCPISENRFFRATNWERNLTGQTILEVGSGSGRFTEHAAATGAVVVSMDYSMAVEANYESNGDKENVLIVQGDIYAMPFRERFFDKLFCFGVLQHTPDVSRSFFCLPKYLKGGGKLAIDVYRSKPWLHCFLPRRWVRPITKRLRPDILYRLCKKYVNLMWPVVRCFNRLPHGRYINRWLMIADYRGVFPLSERMLKEWAVLDTFDSLSPYYDKPQSLRTVKKWFAEVGIEQAEVRYGGLGIEGRGVMPT